MNIFWAILSGFWALCFTYAFAKWGDALFGVVALMFWGGVLLFCYEIRNAKKQTETLTEKSGMAAEPSPEISAPLPITKSLFLCVVHERGKWCVRKSIPELTLSGVKPFVRVPYYESEDSALAEATGRGVHLCGSCGMWHIEYEKHLPNYRRTTWECDDKFVAAHSPIAVCGDMKSILSFGFFEGGEPDGGLRILFEGGWFVGDTGDSYNCLLKWNDGVAETNDLWAYEKDGFAYIAGPLSLDEIKECESLTVVLKSPKGEGVIFTYSFQGAAEAAGMIVAAEQKREAARQERKEQQEWENKLREKQVAQGLVELDGEKAGYVYALSNELYDGLYKIGMTTRTVKERLRELNSETGVPKPFKAEFIMPVKDAAAMEKSIHQQLRRYHERKEFFRVPREVLAKAFEL